ncbi:Ig-like domain-containing protein [Candidatus Desantisbacteria bacterium]|nr:Ig-like domain-containing protein [Candidatus Desantisbacteria bacterium]
MKFPFYKKVFLIIILLGLITGCRNPFSPEETDVKGYVRDSNGNGLANVAISISPGKQTSITNSDGYYLLKNIRTGKFTIKAKKTGYSDKTETVTVESTTGMSCYEPEKVDAPDIEFTTDTTAPLVSSTSPINNAVNVVVNTSITVTFNETMDSTTITTSNFTIDNSVTGSIKYNGTSATYTPSVNLSANTKYTATITTGVKDAAGNTLASNYIWSFTTGTAPDTTGPTVASTTPLDNAVDIALNSLITATFDEAMNASTITSSSFTLSGGITGTVGYSGTTATFNPSTNFADSTKYTATITTSVKDAAGNAMEANHVWSFTTTGKHALFYQGHGDKIIEDINLTSGNKKIHITHDGTGNFFVDLYDNKDNLIDYLVDDTGNYDKIVNTNIVKIFEEEEK